MKCILAAGDTPGSTGATTCAIMRRRSSKPNQLTKTNERMLRVDRKNSLRLLSLTSLLCLVSVISQFAPAQPPQRQPTPNDTLGPPEVSPDRKVTFRIYAPKATSVRLTGSDIPGNGQI